MSGRMPERYLASVEERDIDLLLMGEFYADPDFVSWFCAKLRLAPVEPDAAWHSLSDVDGETDLLLRVRSAGRRVCVLIENKIGAQEQHQQAERYHIRGGRLVRDGQCDEYVTAICAPAAYLEGLPSSSAYQSRVEYEAIAQWFQQKGGKRAEWNRYMMLQAIEQGRRGYTMLVNPVTTAFHFGYWRYLRDRHPLIQMQRPTNKGGRSNWIIMKGQDFPKGVKLHHKLDQNVVELGFDRCGIQDLITAVPQRPDGITVVQKGATASFQIDVPPVDSQKEFASQVGSVETAIQAAYRLMPLARVLQSCIDVPSLRR